VISSPIFHSTVEALVVLAAHWRHHVALLHRDTTPGLLGSLGGVLGRVHRITLASVPSLLDRIFAKNASALNSALLAFSGLVTILEREPLNLVQLLGPPRDDLSLLADAHLVQVCRAEAKLLVKMGGEEARGTHMVSCLLMVPILCMVLVFYRHLSYVIFLL